MGRNPSRQLPSSVVATFPSVVSPQPRPAGLVAWPRSRGLRYCFLAPFPGAANDGLGGLWRTNSENCSDCAQLVSPGKSSNQRLPTAALPAGFRPMEGRQAQSRSHPARNSAGQQKVIGRGRAAVAVPYRLARPIGDACRRSVDKQNLEGKKHPNLVHQTEEAWAQRV